MLVQVTKFCRHHCRVQLNDFQTKLTEMTEIRVKNFNQSTRNDWIVQTVSNLDQKLYASDAPYGTVVSLPGSIWASHPVPSAIVPSFEIVT